MAHERKTCGRPTENPKHEELKTRDRRKELPSQKREGSKAKRTQKANKRPEDYPKPQSGTQEEERDTEDAASDKNQ